MYCHKCKNYIPDGLGLENCPSCNANLSVSLPQERDAMPESTAVDPELIKSVSNANRKGSMIPFVNLTIGLMFALGFVFIGVMRLLRPYVQSVILPEHYYRFIEFVGQFGILNLVGLYAIFSAIVALVFTRKISARGFFVKGMVVALPIVYISTAMAMKAQGLYIQKYDIVFLEYMMLWLGHIPRTSIFFVIGYSMISGLLDAANNKPLARKISLIVTILAGFMIAFTSQYFYVDLMDSETKFTFGRTYRSYVGTQEKRVIPDKSFIGPKYEERKRATQTAYKNASAASYVLKELAEQGQYDKALAWGLHLYSNPRQFYRYAVEPEAMDILIKLLVMQNQYDKAIEIRSNWRLDGQRFDFNGFNNRYKELVYLLEKIGKSPDQIKIRLKNWAESTYNTDKAAEGWIESLGSDGVVMNEARLAYRRLMFKDAERHYRKALKAFEDREKAWETHRQDDEEVDIRRELSYALVMQGKYEEAIDEYKKLIETLEYGAKNNGTYPQVIEQIEETRATLKIAKEKGLKPLELDFGEPYKWMFKITTSGNSYNRLETPEPDNVAFYKAWYDQRTAIKAKYANDPSARKKQPNILLVNIPNAEQFAEHLRNQKRIAEIPEDAMTNEEFEQKYSEAVALVGENNMEEAIKILSKLQAYANRYENVMILRRLAEAYEKNGNKKDAIEQWKAYRSATIHKPNMQLADSRIAALSSGSS